MPHPKNAGYRRGDNWTTCPSCGFEFRASQMRKRWDGLWVCQEDWEERHPQDFVRARVDDTRAAVIAGPRDEIDELGTIPACPTILTPTEGQTIATATTLNVTWAAVSGADSYDVRVYPVNDPLPEPVSVDGLSLSVVGLTAGTAYQVRVNAREDTAGVSSVGIATAGQGRPGCSVRGFTTAIGSVAFSSPTYAAPPGLNQAATITVERSGPTDGAISVHYATSDGTAIAGVNYTAKSGTLNWADGDAADKTFDVQIITGDDYDDELVFNVTLSEPVHTAIGSPGTATVAIPTNYVLSATQAVNISATLFGNSASQPAAPAGTIVTINALSTDRIFITKPSIAADPALTWNGWSRYATDGGDPPGTGLTWEYSFEVSDQANVLRLHVTPAFSVDPAAAQVAAAALDPWMLEGYTSYKFWYWDTPLGDNRGGMSLRVETWSLNA